MQKQTQSKTTTKKKRRDNGVNKLFKPIIISLHTGTSSQPCLVPLAALIQIVLKAALG